VRPHRTSRAEIGALRAVVARDLADAAVAELSADRRFATAYNAALQLAKIVLACAGYRVVGEGHHRTSFQALEPAMGRSVRKRAAYFDTCRRKRNQIEYDAAGVIGEHDARDLLEAARDFRDEVERWIDATPPALSRGTE